MSESAESAQKAVIERIEYVEYASFDEIMQAVQSADEIAVTADESFDSIEICGREGSVHCTLEQPRDDYSRLLSLVFSDDVKKDCAQCQKPDDAAHCRKAAA